MRALFLAVAVGMFASQSVSQNLDGSVEGTVNRADSGDPIPNVSVAFGKFTAATDEDGHFVISIVPPGTYDVTVMREGFVVPGRVDLNATIAPVPFVGKATVGTNQHIKDFHIEMQPTSSISGRILNPAGTPASNVQVQLFWVTFSDGQRRITPLHGSNNWSPSDDHGEFRLFGIPAGEYYLLATPPAKDIHPSSGEPVATFYPAAAGLENSLPIRVLPGNDVKGIDVSLMQRQTSSISVKATVPSSAEEAGFVEASLAPLDSRSVAGTPASCINVKCGFGSGTFTIPAVPEGSYSLLLAQTARDSDYFGEATVQVGDQSVVNLSIALQRGFEVTGHLTVIGDASTLKISSVPIALRSTTNWSYDSGTRANRVQQNVITQGLSQLSNNPTGLGDRIAAELAALDSQGATRLSVVNEHVSGLDSSGGFTIRGLPQGHYAITSSLPAGAYIIDARQKDQSILATGITIGAEPVTPLEIIVSVSGGATVKGTVNNANQLGMGFARVILVPAVDRQRLSTYVATIADYAGRFMFSDVVPGEYKLFSWTTVPPGAWMNATFMEKYEHFGAFVRVKEGETSADMSVQLIPME